MDDQRIDGERGNGVTNKLVTRFRLKWLLLMFIPLSVALTVYGRQALQQKRIHSAYERINRLVFDAHFNANGDCTLYARNGNVTDADLLVLTPIGTGEAGMGDHKVI